MRRHKQQSMGRANRRRRGLLGSGRIGSPGSQRRGRIEHLEPRYLLAIDSALLRQAWQDAGWLGKTVQTPATLDAGQIFFLGGGPSPDELKIAVGDNVNAADTTNADTLQVGGSLGLDLTGAGYTVGIWEAGGTILASHQELAGRVTLFDSSFPTDHATHVAGTIGASGVNPAAKGMATGVSIHSWDATDDTNEMRSDAPNIQVTNHSYGYIAGWEQYPADFAPGGGVSTPSGFVDVWFGDFSVASTESSLFGQYGTDTADLDDVLYDNPALLSMWSAGNDRNDSFLNLSSNNTYVAYFSTNPGGLTGFSGAGWYLAPNSGTTLAPGPDGNNGTGFDSINSTQTAKNSVTVGAISDLTADPYALSAITTTSFSAYGPTDDGRIKPDVVGNGASLFSSTSGSNTSYGTFSGTSMSSPNVAGTSVLLIEHFENLFGFRPQSATTKDLLIHTASDGGNVGPDYSYGWGLVNAEAAANFLTSASPSGAGSDSLAELTYTGSEYTQVIQSDGTGPLKATIVWTDPAGAPQFSDVLDSPTSRLVNDLDIWLTGPGGETYRPWTLNPASPSSPAVRTSANHIDNVEQVLIDAPTSGAYTIHVASTGSVSNQRFSLLVSGKQSLSPGGVSLVGVDFDSPGGVSPNHWTKYSGGATPITLSNLPNEAGSPTRYDLAISTTGTGISSQASSLNSASAPLHSQSLEGLDGYIVENDADWTFQWTDLAPLKDYTIYVFGLRTIPGGNVVTIAGDGDPVTFNQTLTPNNLVVNDGVSSGDGSLSSYAQTVKSTIAGAITINVSSMLGITATALAGLAIRATAPENPTAGASIHGRVWNDLDADGAVDEEEAGLAGWLIYLDDDGDGHRVSEDDLEPDDYDQGTLLNSVKPGVTLTAVGGPDQEVFASTFAGGSASTGQLRFTHNGGNGWSDAIELRIDFETLVNAVSLDAISDDVEDFGIMTAYDANNNLLDSYTTSPLFQGEIETMTISRTAREIAYVIASGFNGEVIDLDRLTFQINDRSIVTDAEGSYGFANLAPGNYIIREEEQVGWETTLAPLPVTIYSTEEIIDADFGNRLIPGSIHGQAWRDLDGDSEKDSGEPGLPNWTVYIDSDRDGTLNQIVTKPSSNVPKAILDNLTFTSSLMISGLGLVYDVNLTLDISHTYVSDVSAYLISPQGTRIALFENVGDSNDDFTETTFDDEATTSILDGSAPFSGSFRPEEALSAFDGQNSTGEWKLEINDDFDLDEGVLNSWSLSFTAPEARSTTTDADGKYEFLNLPPGEYVVRQVVEPEWTQNYPGGPPGKLYFSADDNPNGLFQIDVATGAATQLGFTGVDGKTVGLASSADPNILYGSAPFGLLKIHVDGSGSELLGDVGNEGLAFDPTTGTLYGVLNGAFRTIDTATGAVLQTLVSPNADIEGLEYRDGFIYGLVGFGSGGGVSGELLRYSIAGKAWETVGDTGLSLANDVGLAYNPTLDVFYAKLFGDASLWSIDPKTAAAAIVADTGLSAGGGLAFVGGGITYHLVNLVGGQDSLDVDFGSTRAARIGDYTGDDSIDGADLLTWQQHLGSAANPSGSGADGSGNGLVDDADLALLVLHFGEPGSAVAALAANSVSDDAQVAAPAALDALYAVGDLSSLFAEVRAYRPARRVRIAH